MSFDTFSSGDCSILSNTSTTNNNNNKNMLIQTEAMRKLKRLESGQSDSVWDDEMGRNGCDQLFFVTSYR